jgi:thymidylate kinase
MNFPDEPWVDVFIRLGYAILGAKPDTSVLLMLSLDEAQRRSKNEPFPDSPERRAARHEAYEDLSRDPAFDVVNANRSVTEVFRRIAALVGE